MLWFWWPHAHAWAVLLVLAAVAVLLTWRLPSGPLRRFCGALLAVDALSTLLFIAYAAVGVDVISEYYIGYFYWSAPLLVILVIALASCSPPPPPPRRAPRGRVVRRLPARSGARGSAVVYRLRRGIVTAGGK